MSSGVIWQIISILLNIYSQTLYKFYFGKLGFITTITGLQQLLLLCTLLLLPWNKMPLRQHKIILLLAGLNLVATLCYFKALYLLHPAINSLLGRSFTVFSIIFSVTILHEKIRAKAELAYLMLAIAGLLLFSWRNQSFSLTADWLGATLVLSHALLYSAIFVLLKKHFSHKPFSAIINFSLYSSLFLTIYLLLDDNAPGQNITNFELLDFTGMLTAIMLYLLSKWCFFESVNRISFRYGVTLRSLSPIVNYGITYWFFPLSLHWWNIAGALLLLFAVGKLGLGFERQQQK